MAKPSGYVFGFHETLVLRTWFRFILKRNNRKEVLQNKKLGTNVTLSRIVLYDSRSFLLNITTTAACCVLRIVQDFTARLSRPNRPVSPVPSALRRLWTRLKRKLSRTNCTNTSTRKACSLPRNMHTASVARRRMRMCGKWTYGRTHSSRRELLTMSWLICRKQSTKSNINASS